MEQTRLARPVQILLATIFVANTGTYMALQFLAVYLTVLLHFAAWQVATVLTASLLCRNLLPLGLGLMSDRVGHIRLVILGLVFEGVGFLIYSSFDRFAGAILAAALVGSGAACVRPAVSAIVAAQPEAQRKLAFARFNQALNAGVIVGPLLGSALVVLSPVLPFRGGGLLFFLLAIVLFINRSVFVTVRGSKPMITTMRTVLGHRRFVAFGGIMILFFILFAQLQVSLPLEALRRGHSNSLVSAVFLVNGIAGLLLMLGLARIFRQQHPLRLVRYGVFCTGLGFALIALSSAPFWLLVCVAIYTLGETLVLPAQDMLVAEFSAENAHRDSGAFFGIFMVTGAIGGTIGNYLGTTLMQEGGTIFPWVIYGAIGVVGGGLLTMLQPQNISLHEVTYP